MLLQPGLHLFPVEGERFRRFLRQGGEFRFQSIGPGGAHWVRREPLHPAFVFFREPFEKRDHPGGVDLRPLKQLQSLQIGLSLLLSAELLMDGDVAMLWNNHELAKFGRAVN